LTGDNALGAQFGWLFANAVQDVGGASYGAACTMSRALARVLEAHGGDIRTGAKVDGIRVERGEARGCASRTARRSRSTASGCRTPTGGTWCSIFWARIRSALRSPARCAATRSA
jgi:phytoene dehydrogenase-like protein